MPPSLPRWCIVIPCHNEERAISGVLADAQRLGVQVFVVDDGSTDATPKIVVRHHDVTLLRHDERRGKGEALRTGLRADDIETPHVVAIGVRRSLAQEGDLRAIR